MILRFAVCRFISLSRFSSRRPVKSGLFWFHRLGHVSRAPHLVPSLAPSSAPLSFALPTQYPPRSPRFRPCIRSITRLPRKHHDPLSLL